MRFLKRRQPSVWKGAIAGALGGLAGSWVMNQFQSALASKQPKPQPSEPEQEAEDATMKTADRITQSVAGHGLSKEQKKAAGPFVHYVYGAGIGALYGGASARFRPARAGFGLAYGTAAWALGDEVAIPALKLGKGPAETPLSQHLQALAAHLVYGATLEGMRRLGMKAMRS